MLMHIAVSIITLAIFLPCQALAYLDPGTGSILLQGIIAALGNY